MATYVLVHGGWVGGWDWTEFAQLLRASNNQVHTPTLTGLGERVHLATPQTNLSTHIRDVINAMVYEDLRDVVLAGHSYGGMVISGVADLIPERLAHLVYIDAMVPSNGQSVLDLTGGLYRPGLSIEERAKDGFVPASPPPGASRPDLWAAQPLASFQEKLRLTSSLEDRPFTRTFIYATEKPPGAPMTVGEYGRAIDRIRADSRWKYIELPCGHAIHRFLPEELAQVLLQVARERAEPAH